MANFVQLTLNNGTKNLTYNPGGKDASGVALWRYSPSGIAVEDHRLTASRRSVNNRQKVTLKLELPVVSNETKGSVTVPSVVRTSYVNITFDTHSTSTTAERKEIRSLVAAFLASSAGIALIDSNENLY